MTNKEVISSALEELSRTTREILALLDIDKVLFSEDVKYMRNVAWQEAFSGKVIKRLSGNFLAQQPSKDLSELSQKGSKIYPDHNLTQTALHQ